MLIFSDVRYLPTEPNVMVLQTEHGYFYVGKSTYDASVILADRYDFETLYTLIRAEADMEFVKALAEMMPHPVSSLAPYLALYSKELPDDFEECMGILHVISNVIGLKDFVKLDPILRKGVEFSVSAREEYEMQWNQFFMMAQPYGKQSQSAIYDTFEDDLDMNFDDDLDTGSDFTFESKETESPEEGEVTTSAEKTKLAAVFEDDE